MESKPEQAEELERESHRLREKVKKLLRKQKEKKIKSNMTKQEEREERRKHTKTRKEYTFLQTKEK